MPSQPPSQPPKKRAPRAAAPIHAPGDRVLSRGQPAIVRAAHRKRPGKERIYHVEHEGDAGGGLARASDLERLERA